MSNQRDRILMELDRQAQREGETDNIAAAELAPMLARTVLGEESR